MIRDAHAQASVEVGSVDPGGSLNRRFHVSAVLAVSASLLVGHAAPAGAQDAVADRAKQQETRMRDNAREPAARLKAEIERLAQHAPAKRRLLIPAPQVGAALGITDITNDVQRFFQPGTSFDAAEAILEQAGFRITVSRLVNENVPQGMPDRYATYAMLEEILPGTSDTVLVFVSLHPEHPGDFRTVGSIRATFEKYSH